MEAESPRVSRQPERMDGDVTELPMGGFQERVSDKVHRLLDLLQEIGRHPELRGKLCMPAAPFV